MSLLRPVPCLSSSLGMVENSGGSSSWSLRNAVMVRRQLRDRVKPLSPCLEHLEHLGGQRGTTDPLVEGVPQLTRARHDLHLFALQYPERHCVGRRQWMTKGRLVRKGDLSEDKGQEEIKRVEERGCGRVSTGRRMRKKKKQKQERSRR